MAAGFSLSELTKLYSSAAKAPDALKEGAQILPGSSLLDKLNKLYFTRSSNKMFATASTLATKVLLRSRRPLLCVLSLSMSCITKTSGGTGWSKRYVNNDL